MNLVDAQVLEVLTKPEEKYGLWFVDCKINSYGQESETSVSFRTKEEAERLSEGDMILV